MNDELLALADRLKNAGLNFGDQSDPCSLKVTVPERDTIVSALRLAAQSPEPVTVKPLEWPPRCPRGQRVHNRPALVNYTVAHYGGDIGDAIYRWAEAHSSWSDPLPTYEAAKAAAQADYEQRIRSALVSAPPQSASDGAMREAMLEACDLLAERKQGGYARSPSHNARLVLERALSRDPCGEIKSSDGSVEGHAISGIGSASEQSRQPETPIAGVESGPSEATQPEPEAVTMVRLRSLVMEESSPNMTPDACERQADRIVAAILSRFDVRRR